MHEDHEAAEVPSVPDATVTDLLPPRGQHHTGKIQPSPEPAAWVPADDGPPEAFYPMAVDDLQKRDRVMLYGTIVTIAGKPYVHTPLERCPSSLCPGWVHLPMFWDGDFYTIPEPSGSQVAVSRPAYG